MRVLGLFLLVLGPLFGQNESTVIDWGKDNHYSPEYKPSYSSDDGEYLAYYIQYSWEIVRDPDGSKSFYFGASVCDNTEPNPVTHTFPDCYLLSESEAENLAPIDEALDEFYALPFLLGGVDNPPEYGYLSARRKPNPRSTVLAPPTPPDPTVVFFDGLGNAMVRFDLATNSIMSQIPFFNYGIASNFAVRPTSSGPENEVWVNNAGINILVMDLGSQSVVATVANPTTPANIVPGNIVFTVSGNTALESLIYYTPDSAGNLGAILAFDATTRTLLSTLPLKNTPFDMLMAPDGLTAYILGDSTITYYDVLSGTADLTAPIQYGGGYGYTPAVFIHPDGTRLFVDQGYGLAVFDLTTRQFTSTFTYNLPMYANALSVKMSPDGSTVWVSDSQNNVTTLETRYGNIVSTYQGWQSYQSSNSMVLPGPAH
jgi:hypothetical protein